LAHFNAREFRGALGNFLTGVTIVTSCDRDGKPRGFTASSFTSVSLDPPLILFCVAKTAATLGSLIDGSHFVVHILSDQQRDLSNLFASKSEEKFAGKHWTQSSSGCPVLQGSLVVLHCSTDRMIEAGDHLIVVGQVTDLVVSDGRPLGYCRGSYIVPALTQEAVEIAGRAPRVGALLECNGSLVLFSGSHGQLYLPAGLSLGDAFSRNSLIGSLADYDIKASVDFLFAVFEDEQAQNFIYYRGTFEPGPKTPANIVFKFTEIPWEALSGHDVRMVRRFVDEKRRETAGLYVGGQKQGAIYSFSGSQSWYDTPSDE